MSIYIQITTRCNMACEHCCFACNKTEGEDMDTQTFFQSVALAEEYSGDITLGGGEPTIHPKFWEFFGIAVGSKVEYVWMATNGKIPKIAIALAGLASGSEKFGVALSQDEWHDPINIDVVRTFENHDLEIRNVGAPNVYQNEPRIMNIGSAYENELGTVDECACPGLHIDPNGDIKPCGCLDSPIIGHVSDIDHNTLSRANEVTGSIIGTDCGRDLDQEYIDYIIDNVSLKEAA